MLVTYRLLVETVGQKSGKACLSVGKERERDKERERYRYTPESVRSDG